MSVESTYNILNQSSSSIFFEIPATIQINEEGVTPYMSSTSYKIEILIKELQDRGPFIALGKIGPSCYQGDPFPLKNKFCGKDIYAWKPGSVRINALKESSVLILGAKKDEDGEYVFFTLSKDVTNDTTSYIREYKPSQVDKKIYVVSHKTFCSELFDIYPCTSFEYVKKNFNKVG